MWKHVAVKEAELQPRLSNNGPVIPIASRAVPMSDETVTITASYVTESRRPARAAFQDTVDNGPVIPNASRAVPMSDEIVTITASYVTESLRPARAAFQDTVDNGPFVPIRITGRAHVWRDCNYHG